MRNYLVASDLSARSDAALARALALAAADQAAGRPAHVRLLHVIDEAAGHAAHATDLLAAQVQRVAGPGAPVQPCTIAGDPDETILAEAEALDAALILMGVPRPRRFPLSLAGTTAERVLSATNRPLAVIRRPAGTAWQRQMLALEDAPASLDLLHRARDLGLIAGADVTVLHATNLPGPDRLRTGGMSSVTLQSLDMHAMEELEHRLRRRWREALASSAHLDFALRHGPPAPAITGLQASGHFDLVVMGARGHGSLLRNLLGSTSAEIIRDLDTDLICLPLAD
ncbi:hypothetical protein GL279_10870 [Paracoccus limosus]|uniref:UspA domain-containing protein n=1 Tax=Paracoccus limosus TaxID=913252 RepID=A0A844H658_9RHOB|nr:universal stress protein [Paracoccus limosus]MTH35104.1 hypothetical protein [Paracoccus limosus]